MPEPATGAARTSSLRLRLTAWYGLALGVTLAVFAGVVYTTFRNTLIQRADRYIGDALSVFAREVNAERLVRGNPVVSIQVTAREIRFRNVRYVVRDSAGKPIARAAHSRLPTLMYCSSAPITATGTMGERVARASRMKP